jgi:hypothetical protein
MVVLEVHHQFLVHQLLMQVVAVVVALKLAVLVELVAAVLAEAAVQILQKAVFQQQQTQAVVVEVRLQIILLSFLAVMAVLVLLLFVIQYKEKANDRRKCNKN